MIVLTREQHCLLAGIEIDLFKNLRQRRLLPTIDYSTAYDGKRGYTPSSTLMLLIALELFDECGLNREAAAKVALAGSPIPARYPQSRWPAIALTSLQIARGETVSDPIMCGIIDTGVSMSAREKPRDFALASVDERQGIFRFQGTMSELAQKGPLRRMVIVNLSEIVARMRLAAHRGAIDLDQFWNEG